MGEAKRKRDRMLPVEKAAHDTLVKLANEGKIIAGGLAAYLVINEIPTNDPRVPLITDVFMSSAQHLFSSMMGTLDPSDDITPADLDRLDKIFAELEMWRVTATALRYAKPEGSA